MEHDDRHVSTASVWGGRDMLLTHRLFSFNLGRVEKDSTHCVGAVMGVDFNLTVDSETAWMLGDHFMKNVYSVFSVDTNSVGFAELR